MKICLIGTIASSTLNFRKSFIKLLVHRNHEVYVFSTDLNSKTSYDISALGAHPVSYSLNRGGLNPFADIKSTLQLKKKLESISPDIVFSYFSKPVIFGTLAAKLANVPRIIGMLEGLGYTFTQEHPKKQKSLKKNIIKILQIFLYKISFNFLDSIIFLNKDDPVDLIEKYKINVRDIKILGGIGVDLKKFKLTQPPTDPIRFLFIGRLLSEKGIFEFLKAAEITKNKYPKVEFIVLGSIDAENPSSLAKDDLDFYINKKIIIYPGHVNNVCDWINNSSVFVLPSYREGIPCSTQEAMACGRAIITTDAPGCRETVLSEINGFLIDRFSHTELINKFTYYIENKNYIIQHGKNSNILAHKKYNANYQNEKLLSFVLGTNGVVAQTPNEQLVSSEHEPRSN